MVKDKPAKALDFMVNMKFDDNCIGFAAETKQCTILHNFFVKRSHQVITRISLPAFHMIYGMALQMMMMRKL